MALSLSIGEMMSTIVRRHNAGFISDERFAQASAEFKTEIVDADDFRLEPVEDALIRTSLDFIEQHALNATDALVLCSALDVADVLHSPSLNRSLLTSSSTPPARLKPDPLGQGQFSSPIDGIGLAAHIGLPGI